MNAKEIKSHYKMVSHPEGGSYKETYRSQDKFEPTNFNGSRSISTSILFLLEKGEVSAFHKIRSDELWYFHMGSPLEIIEITPTGELIKTTLGTNLSKGDALQYSVKAGHWFASHSLGLFSLVSCSVAPGFDFEDFEMAKRDSLSASFPIYSDIIKNFT